MTNPSRGELVPGGLSMIKGLVNCAEFNGRVVELVKWLDEGDRFRSPVSGDLSSAEFCGWLCAGDIGHPQHPEEYGCGIISPKNLMPINPEPDPLEITQQQEQSA